MENGNHTKNVPENALFCCFGCMSSVGTLTGVAMLEAYKRLDHDKNGLFCTSAIAIGVPKHKATTEKAKNIIVIDGCYNRCAKRILENNGFKVDRYLNLFKNLKIEKRGPFKPFEYTQEEFESAVNAIIKTCIEEVN
ncbi:MAG: putative zinc-binding protein [Promethearchaeota archaeon]